MNNKTTIEEVFEKFGMGIFKERTDQHTVTSLKDKLINLKLITFLENQEKLKRTTTPIEEQLKKYVFSFIFEHFSCRITNWEQWLKALDISASSILLPEKYITSQTFLFLTSDISSFMVPSDTDCSEYAETLNITVEELYKEISPAYSILTIFNPEDAENQAEKEFYDLSEPMEKLVDETKMKHFISEVFEVVLLELDIDKSYLIY